MKVRWPLLIVGLMLIGGLVIILANGFGKEVKYTSDNLTGRPYRPFQTVDFDHFNRRVADIQARTEDRLVGDRDIIGELRAKDHNFVEACTTVDRYRRVNVVAHFILAAAGTNVRRLGNRESKADLRTRNTFFKECDNIV